MRKYLPLLSVVILSAVLFTSCATQSMENIGNEPGFLKGLLHGFILFFSFIASLFTDYEIYAYPNSGGWYDLGFLLGAMMAFGGSGAGAKCAKS